MCERVAGVGRGRANLERALELGVIDEIASDAPARSGGADLVLVAVPVQQTGRKCSRPSRLISRPMRC